MNTSVHLLHLLLHIDRGVRMRIPGAIQAVRIAPCDQSYNTAIGQDYCFVKNVLEPSRFQYDEAQLRAYFKQRSEQVVSFCTCFIARRGLGLSVLTEGVTATRRRGRRR